MKRKLDFVTNSSSTSYTIHLNNLKIPSAIELFILIKDSFIIERQIYASKSIGYVISLLERNIIFPICLSTTTDLKFTDLCGIGICINFKRKNERNIIEYEPDPSLNYVYCKHIDELPYFDKEFFCKYWDITVSQF